MSRYSLRATPRKKELFDGMVETPGRRSSRPSSNLSIESQDLDGDSSSAAETTSLDRQRSPRPRTITPSTDLDDDDDDDYIQKAKNGRVIGYDDGHAIGLNNGNDTGDEDDNEDNNRKPDPNSGLVYGASAGLRPEEKQLAVDGWIPGQDPRIDKSGHFEFGGTPGVMAMMIGFPLLMWYMWIGATFYDGQLPRPSDRQSVPEFAAHLAGLLYEEAFPSARAFALYWAFFIFEVICYCTLPGVWAYGKPLLHERGRQMTYFCNAYAAEYFTAAILATLHFSGLFPLQTLLDDFGPLLSVAIISGYAVSLGLYLSAIWRGKEHRMTGYPVYDFFMGAELNPRLFGIFDFKMFLEVRIPWFILLIISCSAAARQWDQYGYVSGEVMFIIAAHFLYTNACAKGEELIVTTWDVYFEKMGFMLTFWTMAGVPLSYCHCTLYLANHHPSTYRMHRLALAALFAAYLFTYWVWDTCNSQKNRFRAAEKGKLVIRYTFPQLPWSMVENPRTLTTSDGHTILVDGWYGLARKIHYSADTFMAVSWGLVCGFGSPLPWFYPIFFVCMIIHRATRDIQKCRTKYGETWKEYERLVPYLFIPYVI